MKLAVLGAGGRMGRRLVSAIAADSRTKLSGALARPGSPAAGQDAGLLAGTGPLGIAVVDDLDAALVGANAIIDFTTPDLTRRAAGRAADRGIAHIVGTTGLTDTDLALLKQTAERTCVVQSGNMSLGVNLLATLVRRAASALGEDWDIEIVETHHRMKVDAPSGTALLLGEAAAKGRGVRLADRADRGRDGVTGARRPGDIGFAALRGGTVIGEHSVILAGDGERIELTHRSEDRGLFARGALHAALWARGRPPGYHGMDDVLGLAGAG